MQARVQEAENLLAGLAVPGTDAHTALRDLQSALDAGAVPAPSVLRAGLAALRGQATMCRRAGQSALAQRRPADESPHWTTGTAHDWQRYLRWLVGTLDRVTATGAGATDGPRAGAECARAREVWGAVAGTPGPASR